MDPPPLNYDKNTPIKFQNICLQILLILIFLVADKHLVRKNLIPQLQHQLRRLRPPRQRCHLMWMYKHLDHRHNTPHHKILKAVFHIMQPHLHLQHIKTIWGQGKEACQHRLAASKWARARTAIIRWVSTRFIQAACNNNLVPMKLSSKNKI